MKVLLVNKFHYLKAGAERVYFSTADVLRKNGHEVVFFSMKDERNIECPEEKYFVSFVDFSNFTNWFKKSLRFIYNFQAARNIEKLILAEKPDIAHLHNISHQITYSIVKKLKNMVFQ